MLDAALLQRTLHAQDARVRAYATRSVATWVRLGLLTEPLPLLRQSIADADPMVRLEAIVSASYCGSAEAATVAATAMAQPFNAYHRHALTKTLHVLTPLWAPAVAEGTLSFGSDEQLLFALENSLVENNPSDLANLSGAAVNYQPTASSQRQRILRRQLELTGADAWLHALADRPTAKDIPLLLKHPQSLSRLAKARSLSAAKPADADALLTAMPMTADTLKLAAVWKVSTVMDAALGLAGAKDAELRRAALSYLGSMGGEQAVAKLAAQDSAAAFAALCEAAPQRAVARLLKSFNPGGMQAVLAKPSATKALLAALAKPGAMSQADAKRALQALNTSGSNDSAVSTALMKAAGINASLPVYSRTYVQRLVRDAQSTGDAAEGKRIYESAGCIARHIPGAPQSKIGPDLSAAAKGLPIDMIATELVWPALNVKEGYEAATAKLKDGTVVTGFKHTETPESLAIRELTGAIKTLAKADVESLQTGGTVMPDGLTAGLTEQQVAHLVKYLSTLGL